MNANTVARPHGRIGTTRSRVLEVGTAACIGLLSFFILTARAGEFPAKAADLFQTEKVWNLHLHFTPDQWKAMEPEGDGERGPGARFGGPGGPGGFGPAMFLAPSFLQGDQNRDGKLSKEEFRALGEKWFAEWDKTKSNQLGLDQLREGMNTSLAPGQPGGAKGNAGPPGPQLQGANGHRNGLASAAGIDFKYVHADLEFEGRMLKDVAVRYKGNGTFMESRNSDKRSLKIDLNKYVKGQKIAEETKLNLHNNVTDPSWMNEVLSYRLYREAGVPAPRTAYAKVYVTVPGQFDKKYLGLYSMVEDIDAHFAKVRFNTKEGAIFKPVTRDLFGYLGDDWAAYTQTYDPKVDPSDYEKRRVIEFSKLVTSGSDAEFSAKLSEYLNLDEFARFMSATVWLSTLDSILMMGQNFYVYLHPQTRRFEVLPWDLDHSFGQFPMGGTQDEREQLSILKPWRGSNRFLERVFKVDSFKKLYLDTMKQLSKSLFLPDRFAQQVNQTAAAIRPAVAEESEVKLARFDKVVAGESVEHQGFGGGPDRVMQGGGPRGGGRMRFGPGGFMQPSKPIKTFVVARAKSVEEQLEGKSEGATLSEEGFGGRRGFRGGPGGPPGGFGPGMFLSGAVMGAFDSNKDGKLTHEEFTAGFAKWFNEWNSDHSGELSENQLRTGINHDLSPFRGGPPGGPDFGPPPGGGPPEE